jgi:predicted RNA-binding protein YlxR (DUF448 family)
MVLLGTPVPGSGREGGRGRGTSPRAGTTHGSARGSSRQAGNGAARPTCQGPGRRSRRGTAPWRSRLRVRISGQTPVECWPVVPQLDISKRPDGPIRTCIGCRERTTKRELLRIVAGTDAEGQAGSWFAVPDPRGTAPGRGAHLHPTTECLALAERKRAISRALRHDAGVRGALSLERLREHLQQTEQDPTQAVPIKNWSISS